MHVVKIHSHLNGYEHFLIHKPDLWHEIVSTIESVDAIPCDAEASPARMTEERVRYSTTQIIDEFRAGFLQLGWRADQATDYSRDRIAVRVQFGHPGIGANGSVAQQLASYLDDLIDVGVEILPMKSLQAQMSSGIAYFEGELYNVLRHGRGTPAVPLVLIGVAP